MASGDTGSTGVYRLRWSLILGFIPAMLMGRRRELGKDIRSTLAAARPAPRALDTHHIPEKGPFVLVANHYDREGLRVWWSGMLLSNAVYERRPNESGLRWLMTSEWYNFRLAGLVPVPVWFLRWLFRRIAKVYGLVIVPRERGRVMGRATAMRVILDVLVKQGDPIAMFPEGVGRGPLVEAMPGSGVFFLTISRRGIPIIPAGVYEEKGVLTARFGPPVRVEVPAGLVKGERDTPARTQVMVSIGRLLPRQLWGAYAPEIERAVSEGEPSSRVQDAG
jgi:1-acyl-sn-glycerol-3-phosphate acyltransferase